MMTEPEVKRITVARLTEERVVRVRCFWIFLFLHIPSVKIKSFTEKGKQTV
jgi:hypothetical protein